MTSSQVAEYRPRDPEHALIIHCKLTICTHLRTRGSPIIVVLGRAHVHVRVTEGLSGPRAQPGGRAPLPYIPPQSIS